MKKSGKILRIAIVLLIICAFGSVLVFQSGILTETPYDVTFRIMGKGGKYRWVKSGGNVLRRNDGSGELFGISVDITKQMEEQQNRLLGAVQLSSDVLNKASIGLWAFELDEGQPPRMYGDETMIRLVGLDRQVPPEDMYHAWYDYIDEGSYDLVTDAVARMSSGEHAEVQYPWHHPDGHTVIVRCGGTRNPEYTNGIRIEGTHQDVSETLHFDAKNRERDEKLISGFANEYEAAFLANMTDLSFRVINYKLSIDPDILRIGNYVEASRRFAGKYVHPDDRVLFGSEVFNPDKAKQIMAEGESRSFEYRSAPGNGFVWHKAVFTRISGDEVLLGFKNCSEEVLFRHVNQKVIADFASVFIVDLNDDSFRFLSRNSESGFKDVPGGVYSDTIREYTSRVNSKFREQWKKFCSVDYVREGDTLYIESISRLGRSTKDLLNIIDMLTAKGVTLISHKESIDTDTPTGKFMLTVFAALSQLEREQLKLRQREGIEIAKAQGKYTGRKPIEIDWEKFGKLYTDWKSKSITGRDFMRRMGLSVNTFYRRLHEYESRNNLAPSANLDRT